MKTPYILKVTHPALEGDHFLYLDIEGEKIVPKITKNIDNASILNYHNMRMILRRAKEEVDPEFVFTIIKLEKLPDQFTSLRH